AIHAAQSGELPFPKPGGGGSQGTLPLSVRAMPMTPPSDGPGGTEADVERASQAGDGQPSGQADAAPKKTAPVVQAVIAEEQRQMEMDFGGQVADAETVGVDDGAQMRSAVDGLDAMEAMLQEEGGKKPIHR
ncbi:type VI secretion protein, partial [Seohaeicola saemankumensis]|nr:type VI secretion protein [Seohaeicola saemankumensis]